MKRPLAGVLGGYAGGILLGHFAAASPALLWGLALGSGLLALGIKKLQPWLIWPLLVFCGWANLATHTGILSPDDLRTLLDAAPTQASVRGFLAEPPQIKITEQKNREGERSLTPLDVTALREKGGWQSAAGRILIDTPNAPDARFSQGQSVEISGLIAPPSPPQADGLMDYPEYLRNKDIYFIISARSTNDWQLGPNAQPDTPLTQRFLDWAKATLALGLPEVDEPLKLIWAMALGWRTAFTGGVADPFLQAGTMHLFAIDGLRIALVSGMLITLLRLLRLSRAVCGLICLPVLWFYTAATGWEPSAIRASVMMTIVIGGWALNRPGDLLNSLAAAALILLVWDPTQLFTAGFQLSFLVVLIIALMLPPVNEWINALCQFDPLVPLTEVPLWRQGLMNVLRKLLLWLALSLTAWIGSIPLSAKYFQLFSPVSPLANVVAVPLGMFTLMSIMGSLVCGAWFPWLAVLFNHSAWFFMVALTRVSECATTLPAAYFYVKPPSWVAIGLYYILLVAGLTGCFGITKQAFAKITVLLAFAAAVGIWLWNVQIAGHNRQLTVLPLNGSAVIFVDDRQETNRLLINCGDEDAVAGTLKPFLRAHGINRLPQIVLTTGEAAEAGGATNLVQLFAVAKLYTSTNHFRSAVYGSVVSDFDRSHHHHDSLRLNDTIAGWQVLHPGPGDNWPRGNDNALVLRGQIGGATILLLADLGRNGQSALLGRTNELQADIVISSIPGKSEALCNALIEAAHPRLIIIADSEFPSARRASDPLQRRLTATGIPVVYTRTARAVTISTRPDGCEVTTMDGHSFKFPRAGD